MGKRVYLSHSTQYDNLGVGSYGTEAEEMIKLTNRAAYHLRRQPYGIEVRVNSPDMSLQQTVADSNAFGADIHVANHTNAFSDPKVGGTEVYGYAAGTRSAKLAQCLYDQVAPLSPGSDRGIKYNNGLYEVGDAVKASSALIEHVFHTNPTEASYLQNHIDQFGQAVAKGVCAFYGYPYVEESVVLPQPPVVVPVPDPVPVPQPTNSDTKPTESTPVPVPSVPVQDKPWYNSKTVWVNVLAALAAFAQAYTGQVVLNPEMQLALLAVINAILRAVTKSSITW